MKGGRDVRDILGESLRKLKKIRLRRTRMVALLLVLSLIVSLNVFWSLRRPGLTLAGDADCGIIEHTHDTECQSGETPCALEEHTHSILCYSDEEADLETPLDWQAMFADYPYSGNLRTDLVGIAKTQVGYAESKLNFQIGQDTARRGYTRYGAWYGAPYNDWSAMFVSFCLHYAGADAKEFPPNSGGAAMETQWKAQGKFAAAGQYTPTAGDLVFFKDHSVGIVSEVQRSTIVVIRGDQADAVCSSVLSLKDANIAGWGLLPIGQVDRADLLDISNGPAVYIIEGGTAPQQMAR